MAPEKYTVKYLIDEDVHEIRNEKGSMVSTRVTPGGTIAELMDLGLSQEDATVLVLDSGSMGR